MKKDGVTCWVAPSSPKCMAVSSTDTAPALMALGARIRLVSHSGEREIALADLYNNDGMNYFHRKPDEILAEVLLDPLHDWRSTYWKLRRRGSFDFPVLSVAAAARVASGGVIEDARLVIRSSAPRPPPSPGGANLFVRGSLAFGSLSGTAPPPGRLAQTPHDNRPLMNLRGKN